MVCCYGDVPARGSFLEIARFVVFWYYTFFLFVAVALRAASILENHDFPSC